MAGQDIIDARRGLCVIVVGLVIQNHRDLVRIKPGRQLRHILSGRVGAILAADENQAVAQRDALVLQNDDAVVFQILPQLGRAEIPVVIIALVVVAVDIENAVCGVQLAERFAGGDHILRLAAVVHRVAHDHHCVRLKLLDAPHLAGKGLAVEGDTEMGVRKSRDAKVLSEGLARLKAIIGFKNMVRHVPAQREVDRRENNRGRALYIIRDFNSRKPFGQRRDQAAQQEARGQVQQHDDERRHVFCRKEPQQRKRQKSHEPGQRTVPGGKFLHKGEAVEARQQIIHSQQRQPQENQHNHEPHKKLPFFEKNTLSGQLQNTSDSSHAL